MKHLICILLLLVMAAPLMAQSTGEETESPWFRQARPCALKGVDGLASVGAGYSFAVYTWSEDRAAWLDLAPYFDATRHVIGGFAGLSTEVEGIPIVETFLKPLEADCVGAGVKFRDGHTRLLIHASWHF